MNCKLFDICFYPIDSTPSDTAQIFNYVNTKSMLPNKRGITICSSTPLSGNIRMYKHGDVLISNIQPNFRKIWYATHDGTCSNDILVIRSKSCCLSYFLYCILQTDEFFNHMATTIKGTTIPRGDKDAIMGYKVTLPDLKTQFKISEIIQSIESKLKVNTKLNDNLIG